MFCSLGHVFLFVFCILSVCSVLFILSLVVSTGAIDCLERLVSEMTYYMSSGTLNPTHSLTLLEILEIYWNNFSLLEIHWKLAKSPGNFLVDSKFLYFTVYQ